MFHSFSNMISIILPKTVCLGGGWIFSLIDNLKFLFAPFRQGVGPFVVYIGQ